nr:MAG TPA: hypothetical protein [Caudoviricetes sp.]
MAYQKTTWVNGQSPAIDAEHLNKIEQGIADAAPGGYGLGSDAKLLTSNDDVNTIGASGWYSWVSSSAPTNAIIVAYLTIMRVDAYSSGVKVQTLYGATDGEDFITQPIVVRRMIYGSKIGAWEWVNPKMYLGVEYRTTERYLGKPVYVKAVNFGALPNATIKRVTHGISSVARCVRCCANFNTGDMRSIPYAEASVRCDIFGDTSGINVYTPNDLSSITATGTIWVTKTTD